jgi:cytochrome c biogenesis protein CcmG, thiol:disulfide interchange protein DsbE
MARRLRLLGGAVVVGVIAVVAVFGLRSHAGSARRAPALPRESLIGPKLTLSGLLARTNGRPALVVFWASWCGPCAQEAPALESFSESATGRGRIVGVDWSDAVSGARQFLRRYRWSFPNLRDGEGTIGNEYRLTSLPTTFVIDTSGRIRATLIGPQSERSLRSALSQVEHS